MAAGEAAFRREGHDTDRLSGFERVFRVSYTLSCELLDTEYNAATVGGGQDRAGVDGAM